MIRSTTPGDTAALLEIARGTEVFRPIGVAGADGRVICLWTQLVDGVGQLFAAVEGVDGRFAPPVALTSGAWLNMNVEAALGPDGRVWIAWERESAGPPDSDRVTHDVVAAPLVSGSAGLELGPPVVTSPISPNGAGTMSPSPRNSRSSRSSRDT